MVFFFTYVLCSEHLSDQLSGNAFKYKNQVPSIEVVQHKVV